MNKKITIEEYLKLNGCEISPYCKECVQKHGKIWVLGKLRKVAPCLGCQNKEVLDLYV